MMLASLCCKSDDVCAASYCKFSSFTNLNRYTMFTSVYNKYNLPYVIKRLSMNIILNDFF